LLGGHELCGFRLRVSTVDRQKDDEDGQSRNNEM